MRPSCKLAAVILAAGKGKRMRSDLPKVLHKIHGQPMIHWVVAAARAGGWSSKIPGGHLLRVVEEKDATDEERAVREINGGIYLFEARALFATLPLVKNNNKQNEHYLPDVLYIPGEQNQIVAIEKACDEREILGVNTKEEWRRVHAKVSN